MGDFLAFRKFVTPIVIQVIFWIAIVGTVIVAFVVMKDSPIGGLAILVLGPLYVRVVTELMIVTFSLYNSVHHLDQVLTNPTRAASAAPASSLPVAPPPVPPAS
jgi:hypothetical protein